MFYRMVLRFRSNAIKNWGWIIFVELIFRLYASMQDVHEPPKKDSFLSFWMEDRAIGSDLKMLHMHQFYFSSSEICLAHLCSVIKKNPPGVF